MQQAGELAILENGQMTNAQTEINKIEFSASDSKSSKATARLAHMRLAFGYRWARPFLRLVTLHPELDMNTLAFSDVRQCRGLAMRND